jgi:hypothetical protein
MVEFRKRVQTIHIAMPQGTKHEVTIPGTLTIEQILPILIQTVGIDNIPEPTADLTRTVGLLDKEVELLHLPVPYNDVQYLLTRNASPASTPTEHEDQKSPICSLHVWLPTKQGYLHKKGDKGLRKTWKRRWFSLEKDKLFYYKNPSDKQPISFIAIQRIELIQPTIPFDSVSKKMPEACFQLETPGRIYYLMAENESLQEEWTSVLCQWVQWKRFFGPDRKSSLLYFNELQEKARLDKTQETVKNNKNSNTSQNNNDVNQEDKGKDNEKEKSDKNDIVPQTVDPDLKKEIEKEKKTIERNDAPISKEVEIRVALRDGSIQPLIVDANVEIYDLVYAVAEEIGSDNAFLITALDQAENRRVELLDHQKTLAEHNIPSGAMFLLKKTGIIDAFIGPDDVYDNHFLYVQLPQIEGYLLKSVVQNSQRPLPNLRTRTISIGGRNRGETKTEKSPTTHQKAPEKWVKRWFSLRANKLVYFKHQNEPNAISFIPLFAAISISHVDDPKEIPGIGGKQELILDLISPCTFRIVTPGKTFYLVAETKDEAAKWMTLLSAWKGFFYNVGFGKDFGGEDNYEAEQVVDPHTFLKGSLSANKKDGRPTGRAPWPSGIYPHLANDVQSYAVEEGHASPSTLRADKGNEKQTKSAVLAEQEKLQREREAKAKQEKQLQEKRLEKERREKVERDKKTKPEQERHQKERESEDRAPGRFCGMIGHRGTISEAEQERIVAARQNGKHAAE